MVVTTRHPPPPAVGDRRRTVARFPFETGRNPYQRLLYEASAEEGLILAPDSPFTATALVRMRHRVGVLHFNWRLDRLYGERSARWRIAVARNRLRFARMLRYRIVWTIHELAARDPIGPLQPMEATLGQVADAFLCHDPTLADRAAGLLGIDRSRIDVIPHGPLAVAYPAARVTRATTRERLRISASGTVFLAFGVMDEYKQLTHLLSAFGSVRAASVRLVIAGEPTSASVLRAVRASAAADPRVVLLDRKIEDAEVRELFAAVDVVVSPRRDGWTSGSLVLALNLGVPAIVAACPGYVRLIAEGRAGWVFDPGGGEGALTQVIEEVAGLSDEERAEAGRAAAVSTPASWDEAAAILAKRCLGRAEPARIVLAPEAIDA